MKINESVAVRTSKVLLVPYSKRHVPKYHEWMKDPAIQEATASEPLTLKEEYAMQESWRRDADKLTFIICQPVVHLAGGASIVEQGIYDADEAMIGDVNMFITTSDEGDEEGEGETPLVGELEIMIATKTHQNQGLGRGALLGFLRYVMEHEHDIVDEFLSIGAMKCKSRRLSYLCAKIGESNSRSIGLFESLGFVKTGTKPSYFGEFELKHGDLSVEAVEGLLERYEVGGYSEVVYASG